MRLENMLDDIPMNAIDGNTFLTHTDGPTLRNEPRAAGLPDPWDSRRLWSLWDIMNKLDLTVLLRSTYLGGQHEGFGAMRQLLSKLNPNREPAPLDQEAVSIWSGFLTLLEEQCISLELVASRATVRRIRSVVISADPSYDIIAPLHVDLKSRLMDELDGRTFWSMTVRESELYLSPRKGWQEVIDRFPDTGTDIEEASKCLALSRYAAAAFHSVQVVEIGLIKLGELIEVTDPKSGWTATTNRLSGIIKKGHEARTAYEREHFAFFEQMQGTIEGLKNAWRNKVSHVQGRLALLTADFAPEIAEEILFATRAFMRRLATESPPSADASEPPGA